ncbi:MAG: hypothetical protein KDA60_19535, partial [Planctomycetales bacterium]|nr:hypothetical protein [Planctomycetales bacterium]
MRVFVERNAWLGMEIALALTLVLGAMGAHSTFGAFPTRQWTDSQGRTIRASFVRIHEADVILNRGGKTVRVGVNSLSDVDQQYARAKDLASDARMWQAGGKEIRARYVGSGGGKVQLNSLGREVEIPFAEMVDADRDFVRMQMEADGQTDELAAVGGPLVKPHESETGQGELEDTNESLADAGATGIEQPGRTWTDRRGRTIEASLVRVEGGQVVLRANGSEKSVPLASLSGPDQVYVASYQARSALASAMAGDRRAGDFGGEIASGGGEVVSRPRTPEGRGGASWDRASVIAENARAREARLQEVRERHEQIARENEQWMQQAMQESVAEPAEPFSTNSDHLASVPSPSVVAPERQYDQVEVHVCTNCNNELPSRVGVGDRCPHCKAYLAYEEDANGNRKGGSTVDGLLSVRPRAVAALVCL